jgi:hypothetical protein
MKEHNLACMLNLNFKPRVELFDMNIGYQIVNRLTWHSLYEKSDCLPIYEPVECVYLNYPYI